MTKPAAVHYNSVHIRKTVKRISTDRKASQRENRQPALCESGVGLQLRGFYAKGLEPASESHAKLWLFAQDASFIFSGMKMR